MKQTVLSQGVFGSALAVLITLANACATIPQVKPTAVEPFLKEWQGTWQSSISSANGEVDLAITRLSDNLVTLFVNLTNSRFRSWSTEATFNNGMLIVDRSSLRMKLQIYRDGHLEATYDVSSGDRGYWILRQKKKD
jgi:hypothetical protein